MADKVNIPASLDLQTVKVDPRVINTLERLSKIQKGIDPDILGSKALKSALEGPLSGALTRMLKEGRTSNQLFKTLFNTIDVEGAKAQQTLGKVRGAVGELVRYASTGNTQQFSRLFEAYTSFFKRNGLGDVFSDSLRAGLIKADRDLKAFDAKVRKSNQAAARETANRAKQELDLESKRVKQREQTGFVTNNTDRVKSEKDRADQLARLQSDIRRRFAEQDEFERLYQKNQEKYSKDQQKRVAEELALEERRLRARQQSAYDAVQADNKINRQDDDKRISDLRTAILSRYSQAQSQQNTLSKQETDIERATNRVLSEQLRLQQEINAAEAQGIDSRNKTLRQAKKFVGADASVIARGRLSPPGGGPPPPPPPGGGPPFNDDFFNRTRKGLKDLTQVRRSFNDAGFSARRFGELTALAAKRYSAFLVGTFVFQKLFQGFSAASQQVIEFDKNLTKLRQVTGGTAQEIESLGRNIINSSKATGAGINDVSEGLLIFAQAGFDSTSQLKKVAGILSQLPLTPSFDEVKSTAEGLVAVFGQFSLGLDDTQTILDKFNYVAKETAIESRDLIEAASKSGSAFTSAGANLDDFIESVTLLRSSTRESASVISTFFRTTLTKLQSNASQKTLINILGLDAKNLPVIEQLKLLAPIYKNLTSGEQSNLVQGLVDVRQASRLDKYLKEINAEAYRKQTGQKTVTDLIGESIGSVSKDAKLAKDNLSTSFRRITAAFADMLETLQRDSTVKKLVKDIADLTVGVADLAKNFKSVLGVILAIGGALAIPKIAGFAGGIRDTFNNQLLIERTARNRGISIASAREGIQSGSIASSELKPGLLARYNRRFGTVGPAVSRFGPRFASGTGTALSFMAGFGTFDLGGSNPTGGQNISNNIVRGAGFGGGIGAAFGSQGLAAGALGGSILGLISALRENSYVLKLKTAKENFFQASQGNAAPLLGTATGFDNENVFDSALNFGQKIQGKLFDGINSILKDEILPNVEVFSQQEQNLRDFFGLTDNLFGKSDSQKAFEEANSEALVTAFNKFVDSNVQSGTLKKGASTQFISSLEQQGLIKGSSAEKDAIRRVLLDVLQEAIATGTGRSDKDIVEAQRKSSAAKQSQINRSLLNTESRDLSRAFSIAINKYKEFATAISETTSEISRRLENVFTDLDSVSSISIPSDNKNLLDRSGFDTSFFKSFEDQLTSNITSLSANNQIRDAISEALGNKIGSTDENKELLGPDDFIQTYLGNLAKDQKQILEQTLSQIEGFGGERDIGGSLGKLESAFGNPRDFAKSLVGDYESDNANSIRQQLELVNQEISIRRSLNDSLREFDDRIYETAKSIVDLTKTMKAREIEQFIFGERGEKPNGADAFGLDSITADQKRAAFALKSARDTSGIGNIGTALSFANQQRINSKISLEQLNVNGVLNDGTLPSAARKAESDQNVFDNVQRLFNQGLENLTNRTEDAAAAADLLKNVFNNLRNTAIEAGRGVREMSKQQLAVSLTDLRKFGKASRGGVDIESGINALDSKTGLDNVLKLLRLGGDFTTPSGKNLNNIADKIEIEFSSILPEIIRSVTGEKVGKNFVSDTLTKAFEAQREAAKEERELRQKQKEMLDIQKKVLLESRGVIDKQTEKIQQIISVGNDQLKTIAAQTGKLFNQEVPVVFKNANLTPPSINGSMRSVDDVQHTVTIEPVLVNVKVHTDGILEASMAQFLPDMEKAIHNKFAEIYQNDPEALSRLGTIRLKDPNGNTRTY